jgi:hypothetical protein
MAYTTINDPTNYFQVKTWTGTASSNALTFGGGTAMAPDLVWIKNRDYAYDHHWYDKIRGVQKALQSNTTEGENTKTTGLTAFDSDGFTVGADNGVNKSGDDIIAFCWKSGGTGSSNSDGAISTTRSVNTTAGISIMKYTGSGSGSNIAHGLGAAPEVTIRKNMGGTQDWHLHHSLYDGSHDYMIFNHTNAKADSGLTAASSTLVYTAADSATFMVYAFKAIKGFSKFETYEGNSSADGPFISTGFRPAFIIIKKFFGTTGGAGANDDWVLFDNKRDVDNVMDIKLYPNDSKVESGATGSLDFCSNGFKIRTNNGEVNENDNWYLYMAFAEAPLVNSAGIPCNAR